MAVIATRTTLGGIVGDDITSTGEVITHVYSDGEYAVEPTNTAALAPLTQLQVEDGASVTTGTVTGERIKQAIDKHRPLQLDAGAPWDTATEYVGAGNEQFTLTMPANITNGPFITANGQTLEAGQTYVMIYAADRAAADSVAAIGDDAATGTEISLMNLVGVAAVSRAEVDVISSGLADEINTRTTDDAALNARLDALPAPFSKSYNDLTDQPAIPVVSTDVDFTVDPTSVTDRATLKTALDALNLGKWLPEVATIAARDALTGVVENDKVRVTDAGSGLWVNYQATVDNPTPAQWQIISEEGAQVPPLSEADAIAGTATTDSSISASTLSATIAARLYYDVRETYGLNQRVYDEASGNYYQSLQAGNINHPLNDAAWWEADLAATTDYIRNLGPVATLTDADLALKFPVGDESKPLDIIIVGDVAYQMKIGTTNPQVASSWEPVSIPGTLFLNEITIPLRSAGTNAGSSVAITFYDRNGDTYSPTNFTLNGNLIRYTGVAPFPEINFVDAAFNGTIGIGHNKTGAVSFSWNSDVSLMNGLSRVDVIGSNGGSVGGQVAGSFIGVSDAFQHPANAPIIPPEEFTSQKQTAYDDNQDLTVNTGVGMTRAGLDAAFGSKADKTFNLNPRFLGGIASQAALTALPYLTLTDGIAFSFQDQNWVWHFGLLAADVSSLTALEPVDKPGGGLPGYWVQQGGAGSTAKNALEYPAGSFTALAVNDSGTGSDGAVYKIPDIDALQITLPNKADMDAANGVWRVRISGEWAGLSAQTTPLSFIDDTTNGVVFGDGLPDSGNEWVDLVLDLANERWIATTGGDVTISQVIPSYDEHAQVPAAVRLYLATGTGAAVEGLYRKQVSDNSPQLIG